MKKFSIVFMSICVTFLATLFCACSFKKPEAQFSKTEHIVSIGEQIDLDEYLQLTGVSKTELTYRFSDSSLFEVDGHKIKAKASGKSKVYAFYEESNLASMQVVVRKQFDAPNSIRFEDGNLVWNTVTGWYEGEALHTVASSYTVEWEYNSANNEKEIGIEIVETNKLDMTDFKSGVYNFKVKANTHQYFDASEFAVADPVYYGFMQKIKEEDFDWNFDTGVLTWQQMEDAKFTVRLNGALLTDLAGADSNGYITTNAVDLTRYLSDANSGDYDITVTAYDTNGVKYEMASENFVVTKLATPVVSNDFTMSNGGHLLIKTNQSVESFKVIAENSIVGKLEFVLENAGQDLMTSLDFLKSGVYDISVVAENHDETRHYFKSRPAIFGKVYKLPAVTLTGKGANTENGTAFNVGVENTAIVETSLKVSSKDDTQIFNNFTNGFSWTANASGQYKLGGVLQSKSATSSIDGNMVYIINSNASEELVLTKLGSVGVVMHKYENGNSVLTFSEVDYADQNCYEILHFNGVDYEKVEENKISSITVSNKVVTVVLSGRVETLFEAIDSEFEFKIVANTLDSSTSISSTANKTLTLLGQPTAPETGNPQNGVFVWNAVENADKYSVEIYYTNNKDIFENKDLSLFEKTTTITSETQLRFNKVGYYIVRVYAVADTASENLYISSAVALERTFHISEKVTIGNVQLRNNGSNIFLRIFNNDSNVKTYTISVTGQADETLVASGESYDDYTLNKSFFAQDTEITVTVTANASDTTLRPSDSYSLSVEKLRNVTPDDVLVEDDHGYLISLVPYKNGLTSKITYDASNKTSAKNQKATLDVSNVGADEFNLTFEFVGSDLINGIYDVKDNKVFLNCDEGSKTIAFSRIAKPEQLIYENGKFNFIANGIPANSYSYVLEATYKNANNSNFLIAIKFDGTVTATIGGSNEKIVLGQNQDFIDLAANTIDFNAIETAINSNAKLEACYRQMENPKFSLFVSYKQYDTISEKYLFSSRNSVETQLEKLPDADLKFRFIDEENKFKFSWQVLETSSLEISNVNYKLFVNAGNTSFEEISGFAVNYETTDDKKFAYLTLNAQDFEAGVFYNFYLSATQPHFLGTSVSNNLIVYRLNPVNALTLNENELDASVTDAGYAQKVIVTVGGNAQEFTIEANGNFAIPVAGEGEYAVKVVAKESSFNEVTKTETFYIDSLQSKWTLKSLDAVASENVPQLRFSNEIVSWDKFAGNFGENLHYVLIFKDQNSVTAETTTPKVEGNTVSVELDEKSQIYKDLSKLSAGEIEIQVSAYLSSYSTSKNGVIYFADSQTLLNGKQEFNHFVYQKITNKKLATPNITNITFDKGTDDSKVENPDVIVTFERDYDFQNGTGNDSFKIFVSSTATTERTQLNVTISEKTTGVFEFVLNATDYAFVQPDETLILEILAVSSVNMPSTFGSKDVYMAKQVRSVEFETELENGKEFAKQNVIVTLMDNSADYVLGGIVLKVTDKTTNKVYYLNFDATIVANTISCDLTDFVKTNLKSGANISVEAFINSYSENGNYILACKNKVSTDITENIVVLGGVATTDSYDETTTYNDIHYRADAGGFQILPATGKTLSDDLIFVVSYKVGEYSFETKEITKDDNFYFEFPAVWTDEGDYSLSIFAKQSQSELEGVTNVYVYSWTNTLTFQINRAEKISQVQISRDETNPSELNIEWNSVANVSEYIFRVYNNVNGKLIFSTTTTSNVNTLSQLFWANYNDFENVNLTIGTTDIDARFEVISVGKDGTSNSQAYTFFAYLRPNNLSYQSLEVLQDYGTVTFATLPNYSYLYRFVSGNAVVQDWKKVTAQTTETTLDTSELEIESGNAFNVEIIILGSADNNDTTITENATNFVFDSYVWTSALSSIRLGKSSSILNVRYDQTDATSIILEMSQATFTNLSKVLVGVEENAVFTQKVVSLKIDKLTECGNADGDASNPIDTTRRSYAYPLSDMLAVLKELGVNYASGNITVYFWTLENEVGGLTYVVSDAFGFDIALSDDIGFVKVDKLGNNAEPEDNANTFVLFEKNDNLLTSQTLGINVKIDYVETTYIYDERGNVIDVQYADATAYRFIDVTKLKAEYPYYDNQDYYVIDLVKMFEEEGLNSITGNISLEFLRVRFNLTQQMFIVTDWLSGFEFVRLAPITYATLSGGNIEWSAGDAVNAEGYYIYFFAVDADGNKSDSYSRFEVGNQTAFDASKFGGQNCFIEIQAISSNPFVLASSKYSVSEDPIIKNQLSGKLKLAGGSFTIDYDNKNGDVSNNIYKFITENRDSSLTFEERAKILIETTWTYPFTFKLASLLNGQVTLRMTFISNETNKTQSVDVNAKDLLTNLAEFSDNNDAYDIIATLEEWAQGSTTESYKRTLEDFMGFIEKGSHGVANENIIFDSYFEKIQAGEYSIVYCLLGGSASLNSTWMTFENQNIEGNNSVYVNGETTVTAKREKIDSVTNSYKVVVKKEKIYDFVDGAYTAVDASQYVLQLATKAESDNGKSYAFSIDNFSGDFRLHYLSANSDTSTFDTSKSISVYQSDKDGNKVTLGEYLMFYINQNNGDSILGVFGDMVPRTIYGMQIYAVGNDNSLSSKSEYFKLTLLSFGDDFAITDGVLSWTTQLNRNITVMYRTLRGSEMTEEIVTENSYATYSLDGKGEGTYSYIKFVVAGGDVVDNNIMVDSDIFEIDNVYKLASPKLTNYLGYLSIDETQNGNRTRYNSSYSDGSFFQYMIYNNNNDDVYIKRVDTTLGNSVEGNGAFLYVPGRDGDEDYRYKSTEVNAENFQVISVGSTVENVSFSRDQSDIDENGYNKKYYINRLDTSSWTNAQGNPLSAIALQSSAASLSARMLDSVQNLKVTNGRVVWSGVEGRTEDDGILTVESQAEIIYKVSIEQYSISKTDDNTSTEYTEQIVEPVYTRNAELDFADIEDKLEILDSDKQIFIKISVQALALFAQANKPNTNYVELISGGYAYGNVVYASAETETFVLLSEINDSSSMSQILRLKTVTSLEVSDGKLQWIYKANNLPNGASLTVDSFDLYYKFIVEDEDGNEITGTFEKPILQSDGTFLIKFNEEKGQMKIGNQKIKVYATTGANLDSSVIKSRGVEITVNKLDTISSNDFSIQYVGSGVDMLDLSDYFKTNQNHEVVVTFYNMYGNLINTTGNPFTLTYNRSIIYLISSPEQAYDNEYNVVIDSISGGCNLTFKVKYNATNVLYSDVSDFIPLQRVEWQQNDSISWDSTKGEFSWNYTGYLSLNQGVDAEILGFAVSRETTLYDDANLTTPSELENNKLASGTVLDILEKGNGYIKISYLGGEYFVSDMFIDRVPVDTFSLSANTLLKVVETDGDYSIIKVKDADSDEDREELYRVLSSAISKPVYIIEADYRASGKKYYTTEGTIFKPTVVGYVTLNIRVKLGPANIQSEILQYNNGDFVLFNLFAGGDGTQATPYRIANADQFRNIQYRMKLEDYLKAGEDDNSVNYFDILADIDLTNKPFNGVLFKGTFEGVVNGNGHKITYKVTATDELTYSVYVDTGFVKSPISDVNSTTFLYGASLFERTSTNSSISNLRIDADYSDENTVLISVHSLMAGLAISNYGMISNIELVGFNTNFSGYNPTSRPMMVYSGIVSQNIGEQATVSNCFVSTDMIIADNGSSQVIFASGIAFINQTNAKILNCMTGYSGYTVNFDPANAIPTTNKLQVLSTASQNIIQLAGVCITNANAIVSGCQNNLEIDVEGISTALNCTVYIAGLVDYQGGTMTANVNNGTLNIPHGFGSCNYALNDSDFGTRVETTLI